jgi:polysaccharide deacetylase family protein (PEP-CTERM system associated)
VRIPAAATVKDAVPSRHAGDDHRHILTVAIEDYYQGATFNRLIPRARWHRFESRLVRNTQTTLDLLDEFDVRATFFALGWVADAVPELIREVVARGHDIASKGYFHRAIREFSRDEFSDDCARAREALERASGRSIDGYRVAQRWLRPEELWALDVLAEEGYKFDSSIRPLFREYVHEPWRRFVHQHHHGERTLWEVPVSSAHVMGYDIPIAGANYFRQLPFTLVQRAVRQWDRSYEAPFVMYFHVWELDPDQPKIDAAPFYAKIRQYRNLDRMAPMLRYYFEQYRFTSIGDRLGIESRPATAEALAASAAAAEAARMRELRDLPVAIESTERSPISIVIPCFNEELILPYLSNTLVGVEADLSREHDVHFVFVDDGSSDATWASLQSIFGGRANCTLIQHEVNRGVAATIMTGIRASETEIVCSMDCDCTYDPHELGPMVTLLAPDVDMVTASPYHREGKVLNVPGWRLFLSRTLSRMYGMVLRHQLATYTACFRVYRRSAVADVPLSRTGFIGVAELLGRLDLGGSEIIEYPTTLEVRILGRSKMKILKTIAGHIDLLIELMSIRLFHRQDAVRDPSRSITSPSLPRAP